LKIAVKESLLYSKYGFSFLDTVQEATLGIMSGLNYYNKIILTGNFIDKYLETFKGVDKYMTDIVKFAKEHGYVETLFNRRRALPDINAKNKIVANLNARIAMNSPIQGTAADIIKIAMVNVFEYLEKTNVDAKLLLQVHDELIFEVEESSVEKYSEILADIMKNTVKLEDVNLNININIGKNWAEAK